MVQNISVTDAAELLKKGDAVLIDVREPDEFKDEHIVYALSLPLSRLENGIKILDLPQDKIILFQCLKGSRGQMACQKLNSMNDCPNPIANVEGGIQSWKDHKLPVVSNLENKGIEGVSIFRQVQIAVGLLMVLFIVIGFMGVTVGFLVAGLLSTALLISGLTGWCGMAILLSKMPWNKR